MTDPSGITIGEAHEGPYLSPTLLLSDPQHSMPWIPEVACKTCARAIWSLTSRDLDLERRQYSAKAWCTLFHQFTYTGLVSQELVFHCDGREFAERVPPERPASRSEAERSPTLSRTYPVDHPRNHGR